MPSNHLANINIIGAGKLGETLARDINNYNLATTISIFNKSYKSSLKVAQRLNHAKAYKTIKDLPSAELTFITTPDDAINICANELAENINIKKGDLIIHCSGVLSSDELNCLQEKGCLVASLHPMRSFTNLNSTFNGSFCAIEGDVKATLIIKSLFKPLELQFININKNNKASYHCGGVFASNYLISILKQATLCYQSSGIDSESALKIASSLAQSTLNNIEQTNSLADSLTGPLARFDLNTIEKHFDVIKPDTKLLYKNLAHNLLDLTTLSDKQRTQLKMLLNEA